MKLTINVMFVLLGSVMIITALSSFDTGTTIVGRVETLSDQERVNYASAVELTPRDITLRVETRENFQAYAVTMTGIPSDSHVMGYTTHPSSGCVIHVPEGHYIIMTPSEGRARWDEPDFANTVAHEILHCLRGPWHRAWTEIPRESPPTTPSIMIYSTTDKDPRR